MARLSVCIALVAAIGCGASAPTGADAGETAAPLAPDADPRAPDAGGTDDYTESFDGAAAAWPAAWIEAGGVDRADVAGGRARLLPLASSYSLGRMHSPGNAADSDVRFAIAFDDLTTQGIGFYVRQNGVYLADLHIAPPS